jgi:hypothetical protein
MRFYEHHTEPLVTTAKFWRRMRTHSAAAVGLFAMTILIGVVGFRVSGLGYTNSLLDSAMLMSGMGPVNCDKIGNSGKIFASLYALFCGIVFVAAMGIVLAPLLHRLLHTTHHDRSTSPSDQKDK